METHQRPQFQLANVSALARQLKGTKRDRWLAPVLCIATSAVSLYYLSGSARLIGALACGMLFAAAVRPFLNQRSKLMYAQLVDAVRNGYVTLYDERNEQYEEKCVEAARQNAELLNSIRGSAQWPRAAELHDEVLLRHELVHLIGLHVSSSEIRDQAVQCSMELKNLAGQHA
jgi:hypothetical protein